MATLAIDLLPSLQRQALLEIMEDNKWSMDWVAGQMKVPTEWLRRWLNGYTPETNRQRLEWHEVQAAVVLFLATKP